MIYSEVLEGVIVIQLEKIGQQELDHNGKSLVVNSFPLTLKKIKAL